MDRHEARSRHRSAEPEHRWDSQCKLCGDQHPPSAPTDRCARLRAKVDAGEMRMGLTSLPVPGTRNAPRD